MNTSRPWSEMKAELATLETQIAEADAAALKLRQRRAYVHNSEFPSDYPANLIADKRSAGLHTAQAIESLDAQPK